MFYLRRTCGILLCFLIFGTKSYGKEFIYFANRIPVNPPAELLLPLESTMTLEKIQEIYAKALLDRGDYFYNGPWVFSFLSEEGKYEKGKLPKETQALDILRMITKKIETSSVMVAVVSGKAYGTIAEIGYAVAKGNIPVYVFPDPSLSQEEVQDLWFVFQMGAMTSCLWKEEHFNMPSLLPKKTNLQAYRAFLETLKPSFL